MTKRLSTATLASSPSDGLWLGRVGEEGLNSDFRGSIECRTIQKLAIHQHFHAFEVLTSAAR